MRTVTGQQCWGDGTSFGVNTNDADELCGLGRFLESAVRLKHVVGHVKDIVPHPAVWIKK